MRTGETFYFFLMQIARRWKLALIAFFAPEYVIWIALDQRYRAGKLSRRLQYTADWRVSREKTQSFSHFVPITAGLVPFCLGKEIRCS